MHFASGSGPRTGTLAAEAGQCTLHVAHHGGVAKLLRPSSSSDSSPSTAVLLISYSYDRRPPPPNLKLLPANTVEEKPLMVVGRRVCSWCRTMEDKPVLVNGLVGTSRQERSSELVFN